MSPPTISTPMAARRWRNCWRAGRAAAWSQATTARLLERVDRIVELTPIGVTVFGGPWSAFAEAREAARERAEADLDRASDALRSAERSAQKAVEKKARRDKAGRAYAASGCHDTLLLGAMRQRAENSAARENRIS